jgi:KDO2-lipid IV(A) lauroyltransferase
MAEPKMNWTQDLAWRLEAVIYDLFTGLFRLLPLDLASAAGGKLGQILGPLSRAHRVAAQNLALAFPERDAAWHKKALQDQWDGLGRSFAEFPQMDRILPSTGRVEVVNAERLRQIAEAKEPVVFISGHLSNWEVMPAAIVDSGIVCQITYRAANNPYVDERIKRSRFRYGVRLFAPKGGDGARELLDALGKGESVALMNDQKFNGGIGGPFFGHLCHTAPGPSRLALRFKTVLQPMSVQRLKGARFRVVVHEPICVLATGHRQADLERAIHQINGFMEERIRERPAEWFWVHKRWANEVYDRLRV